MASSLSDGCDPTQVVLDFVKARPALHYLLPHGVQGREDQPEKMEVEVHSEQQREEQAEKQEQHGQSFEGLHKVSNTHNECLTYMP